MYDKSGSCGKEITKILIEAKFQSSSFEIEVSFSVKNMHSLDNNSGSTGVSDFFAKSFCPDDFHLRNAKYFTPYICIEIVSLNLHKIVELMP